MIHNIMGYGQQKGYRQLYRGAEYHVNLLPKKQEVGDYPVDDAVCDRIIDRVVENRSIQETTAMVRFLYTMWKMRYVSRTGRKRGKDAL